MTHFPYQIWRLLVFTTTTEKLLIYILGKTVDFDPKDSIGEFSILFYRRTIHSIRIHQNEGVVDVGP